MTKLLSFATTVAFALFLLVSFARVEGAAPPFGALKVSGTKLLGSSNQQVQLIGMSLFWSQWDVGYAFWNAQTVNTLKCKWNANVVRAAMGIQSGGYMSDPTTNKNRLTTVVDAAIAAGIYVIIDWHSHTVGSDSNEQAKAIAFFTEMSEKYKNVPNVLYETFNEPEQVDWNSVVKPYHEKVVKAIRANDAKAIIILGTPTWSQDVDVAANNPVSGTNLMYTLHYYAASHKQSLRDKATAALKKNIAIFVTEYGTCDASGGGSVDATETNTWWKFLDTNKISYANWAIENKNEAAAALVAGTTSAQLAADSSSILSTSGKLVKAWIKTKNNGLKKC